MRLTAIPDSIDSIIKLTMVRMQINQKNILLKIEMKWISSVYFISLVFVLLIELHSDFM